MAAGAFEVLALKPLNSAASPVADVVLEIADVVLEAEELLVIEVFSVEDCVELTIVIDDKDGADTCGVVIGVVSSGVAVSSSEGNAVVVVYGDDDFVGRSEDDDGSKEDVVDSDEEGLVIDEEVVLDVDVFELERDVVCSGQGSDQPP